MSMKARNHPAFADDKQNTVDDVDYMVKLYKRIYSTTARVQS